jgi:hypothetical protein
MTPNNPIVTRRVLLYDGDCGFCTRSATWLVTGSPADVAAISWQTVPDLTALGLTQADVTSSSWWLDGGKATSGAGCGSFRAKPGMSRMSAMCTDGAKTPCNGE